jgi:hypothetical protein
VAPDVDAAEHRDVDGHGDRNQLMLMSMAELLKQTGLTGFVVQNLIS